MAKAKPQTQEPQESQFDSHIVLLIGCTHPEADDLKRKLFEDLVVEANAQTVELVHVQLASYWWDDPTMHDKLHELLDLFPRKSKQTALKWIKTDGFVQEIRKLLTEKFERSTSPKSLPADWHELVSLVILDVDTETSYVQRIFDGWFPNAMFRANCGHGKTVPIWREAEVVPIEGDEGRLAVGGIERAVASASPAEVLDWYADQLPGLPPAVQNLASRPATWKVADLVQMKQNDLWHLGVLFTDIERTLSALDTYNLWLGMTDAEVADVRAGAMIFRPRSRSQASAG